MLAAAWLIALGGVSARLGPPATDQGAPPVAWLAPAAPLTDLTLACRAIARLEDTGRTVTLTDGRGSLNVPEVCTFTPAHPIPPATVHPVELLETALANRPADAEPLLVFGLHRFPPVVPIDTEGRPMSVDRFVTLNQSVQLRWRALVERGGFVIVHRAPLAFEWAQHCAAAREGEARCVEIEEGDRGLAALTAMPPELEDPEGPDDDLPADADAGHGGMDGGRDPEMDAGPVETPDAGVAPDVGGADHGLNDARVSEPPPPPPPPDSPWPWQKILGLILLGTALLGALGYTALAGVLRLPYRWSSRLRAPRALAKLWTKPRSRLAARRRYRKAKYHIEVLDPLASRRLTFAETTFGHPGAELGFAPVPLDDDGRCLVSLSLRPIDRRRGEFAVEAVSVDPEGVEQRWALAAMAPDDAKHEQVMGAVRLRLSRRE